MPKEPVVWIALFGLVAMVVSLALWLGRGFSARSKHFKLKVKEPRLEEAKRISLAEDAKLKDVKTRDIVGIKIEGAVPIAQGESIEILKRAVVEGSNIRGDIAGVKMQGKPEED